MELPDRFKHLTLRRYLANDGGVFDDIAKFDPDARRKVENELVYSRCDDLTFGDLRRNVDGIADRAAQLAPSLIEALGYVLEDLKDRRRERFFERQSVEDVVRFLEEQAASGEPGEAAKVYFARIASEIIRGARGATRPRFFADLDSGCPDEVYRKLREDIMQPFKAAGAE